MEYESADYIGNDETKILKNLRNENVFDYLLLLHVVADFSAIWLARCVVRSSFFCFLFVARLPDAAIVGLCILRICACRICVHGLSKRLLRHDSYAIPTNLIN